MKQNKCTIFLSILFFLRSTPIYAIPSAITFNISPGSRFGDQLVLYIKAKWIAHCHKMPFYCLPVPLHQELMLGQQETIVELEPLKKKFKQWRYITSADSGKQLTFNKDNATLYIIDLTYQPQGWNNYTDIEKITDPLFKQQIRQLCQPITPLTLIHVPKDTLSVALHVRKGGGYDRALAQDQQTINPKHRYADQLWPLKFPPDSFYIDQLKAVYDLCGKQALYIYLFTDDPDPAAIAQKYSAELDNTDISFDYRRSENRYNKNILEDFFSITQCNIIIRGDSSFSTAAQFLGNPLLAVYPTHCHWEGNTLIIDNTTIKKLRDSND